MIKLPTPIEVLPSWSETWGSWNSRCLPGLAWLEEVACLKGRYAVAPSRELQVIPASGQIAYNIRLIAGSVIWGFAFPAGGRGMDDVSMQITDLQLGHAFFQEPLALSSLTPSGRREGWFESFVLFPCPHPVVDDGLFRVEFWGPVDQIVFTIFGVAEVASCNRLGMS